MNSFFVGLLELLIVVLYLVFIVILGLFVYLLLVCLFAACFGWFVMMVVVNWWLSLGLVVFDCCFA